MVRLKHRYLLTEIIFADGKSDASMKSKDIGRVLKDSLELVHGSYGLGSVIGSLQVKYFNPVTSVALIRVSRDNYDILWSAMTFITQMRKRECLFRVIHLGGTIRSCQKVLLEYNREQLTVLLNKVENPVEKKKIEEMILATSKDSFTNRY